MRSLLILLIVVGSGSLWSAPEPLCSQQEAKMPPCPHPEALIRTLIDRINENRQWPISKVLPGLKFPTGTVFGAHFSISLQGSESLDNPRIYLLTECGPLTFNLYGKSLEMGVVKQKAFAPVAGEGPRSKEAGEVLIDFSALPREKAYTPSEVVNHLDPVYAAAAPGSAGDDRRMRRTTSGDLVAHDTHACSTCHVDAGRPESTLTSMGQTTWRFGNSTLEAIVSPYERRPGEKVELLSYDLKDLQALYACKCKGNVESCRRFTVTEKLPARAPTADREACARLKFVLDLKPLQHCDFAPEGRFRLTVPQ